MTEFDEEYLEVFGSESNFQKVSNKIKIEVLKKAKKRCKHTQITKLYSGQGCCMECGKNFQDADDPKSIIKCLHTNKYEDSNGLFVCRDCGHEWEMFDFQPEWRYYGSADNRSNKDPARCLNSQTNKSLDKVYEDLHIDIPQAIKELVKVKYIKVTCGKTFRGRGRKACICICTHFACREFGEIRPIDHFRNQFELTRKDVSDALSKYYEAYPKDRTKHTKPQDLLRWVLMITGIDQEHYRKIKFIADYFEGSSRLLIRSSPQSVASAIVYFYLCLNPEYKSQLGLTKNVFARNAQLSDITITKLVKEASEIANYMIHM